MKKIESIHEKRTWIFTSYFAKYDDGTYCEIPKDEAFRVVQEDPSIKCRGQLRMEQLLQSIKDTPEEERHTRFIEMLKEERA